MKTEDKKQDIQSKVIKQQKKVIEDTKQYSPANLKSQQDKKRKKNKNENILCAIIALMKELDKSGLEFVKMDATKRINKLDYKLAKNGDEIKPLLKPKTVLKNVIMGKKQMKHST